jgi:hypothetical protein
MLPKIIMASLYLAGAKKKEIKNRGQNTNKKSEDEKTMI